MASIVATEEVMAGVVLPENLQLCEPNGVFGLLWRTCSILSDLGLSSSPPLEEVITWGLPVVTRGETGRVGSEVA